MLPLLALLFAPHAQAQDGIPGGVNAHGFQMAPGDGDVTDFLGTWNASTLQKGQFSAGGLFEYARSPFLADDRVVDPGYGSFHVGAAFGIIDRIGVALHIPVHMIDRNPGGTLLLGDMRLAVPVGIVGDGVEGFAFSAVPYVGLPTGPGHRFLGYDSVTGGAFLAAGYGTEKLRFDGNLGYQFAPTIEDPDIRGGGRLMVSVGGAYRVVDTLGLRLEYLQGVGVASGTGKEAPGEVLFSARGRYDMGFNWTAGVAGGLVPGLGAAQYRLFVGAGWSMGRKDPPPEPEPVPTFGADVRVKDPYGGPAANMPVFLDGQQVGRTDSSGRVMLTDLDAESAHTVEVRPDRSTAMGPFSVDFTMPKDSNAQVSVALEWLPGAVKVVTRDEAGKPISSAKTSFLGSEKDIENLPIGDKGEKVFVVDPGVWTVLVTAPTFGSERFDLDISPDEKVLVVIEVTMEPAEVEVEKKEVRILKKIFFEFDSHAIKSESMGLVSEVAATLLEHKDILKVEVQGHTDDRGSADYNKELSQRRVNEVVNALVRMGVAKDRLVPVGYGQSKPLESNATEEGRAQNRRVQFIILERAD